MVLPNRCNGVAVVVGHVGVAVVVAAVDPILSCQQKSKDPHHCVW